MMKKENQAVPINSKAKDRLFYRIYSEKQHQKNLVAFLLGKDIDQIGDIDLITLDPVLLGEKENDLALLFQGSLCVLMEEQSYSNPNIVYRILEYLVAELRTLIDTHANLYGSKLIRFPIPKLYSVNVGVERNSMNFTKVQYDLSMDDAFLDSEIWKKQGLISDLQLTVHVYDFRMTAKEVLEYINEGVIPERFNDYRNELLDYALLANSITYMQRYEKEESSGKQRFVKPNGVETVAQVIALLKQRGIFEELLSRKEIIDMTVAQFNERDMYYYHGYEEGLDDAEEKYAKQLQEKDDQLQEKDDQLQQQGKKLQEKDNQLQEKDNQLQQQDQLIQDLQKKIDELSNK